MNLFSIQSWIWGGKKLIAFFAAIALVVCNIGVIMTQRYTAEIYIKYLGQNAANGKTENGEILNPYEINSSYIIRRAMEQLDLDTRNSEQIRHNVTVTPITPIAEEEKYASWIDQFSSYEEDEEGRQHAVYYSIKFTTDKGITYARNVLNALVYQYRKYYVRNYTYISDVEAVSKDNLQAMDYYDAAEELESKIKANVEYLRGISDGENNYHSFRINKSASDIVTEFTLIQEGKLAEVKKLILDYGISKDKQTLITKLQRFIKEEELSKDSNAAKAKDKKMLMLEYAEKNKEFLWESAEDGRDYNSHTGRSDNNEQVLKDEERDTRYSRAQSEYDQLTMDYVEALMAESENKFNIKKLKSDLKCFQKKSKANVDVGDIESRLDSVFDMFTAVQKDSEVIIEGFNGYKMAKSIFVVSGISVSEKINDVIYYAISLVLGAGFAVVLVIYLNLMKLARASAEKKAKAKEESGDGDDVGSDAEEKDKVGSSSQD